MLAAQACGRTLDAEPARRAMPKTAAAATPWSAAIAPRATAISSPKIRNSNASSSKGSGPVKVMMSRYSASPPTMRCARWRWKPSSSRLGSSGVTALQTAAPAAAQKTPPSTPA